MISISAVSHQGRILDSNTAILNFEFSPDNVKCSSTLKTTMELAHFELNPHLIWAAVGVCWMKDSL